jgi:hypothetical protein
MEDLDEEILAMVAAPKKLTKRKKKAVNSDNDSDYGTPAIS